MTNLTDKLADALEAICKNYDCDTSEGGKHFPERCRCCIAESALLAYRAQRDGERFGYRMLEVGEEIETGDEFRDPFTKVWIKAHLGGVIHPALAGTYRRPLAKGEA